jgi:hypothetical protein
MQIVSGNTIHEITDMHLLSLAVLYLSSVVIMISSPELMRKSWSFTVFPVLISGPFCEMVLVSVLVHTDAYSLTCRIQSNSQWSATHLTLSFSRVINHRLVVLCCSVSLSSKGLE